MELMEVSQFLTTFQMKMKIFDVLFLDDRSKNGNALTGLEMRPMERLTVLERLTVENYSEGPKNDNMMGSSPLWVFGSIVNGVEIYIKLSLGMANSSVICVSFHPSEYKMKFPFRK